MKKEMKKENKDGLSTPESPKAQPPHGTMHPKSERMDHEIFHDKMAKGLGC